MRIIEIIILFIFVFVSNIFSKEIYVNGAKGMDSLSYDGSTPAQAFKSIKKALSIAESGDDILIEGLNGDNKIVYKESNVINKESIRVTGINNPIIDGTNNKTENNVAFFVNYESFTLQNVIIRKFLDGKIKTLNLKGGAGVASNYKLKDLNVFNCIFEECNFGVVAYENQSIRIYGNKFNEILKSGEDLLDGGIGLLIWSNGAYIQDNYIGSEKGNEFNSCERYGILLGSENKLVLADYSKIENNKFNESKKGTGLGIFSVEGIFSVKNNIFHKNLIAIELKGESIDVSIESNIFKGSLSESEIVSDEKYPGENLYSIWKTLGNKFDVPTYSKSMDKQNTEIILSDGKRYIRNKLEAAENDGNKNGYLLK